MSMELWVGLATLVTVTGGGIALYFALRKPARDFEARTESRFDRLESRLTSEIKGVNGEIRALDERLTGEIRGVDRRLTDEIKGVAGEIRALDEKLGEKIDGVHAELIELRGETRQTLGRHDERIAALERHRPSLLVP